MTNPAETPGMDRAAFMTSIRAALGRDVAAGVEEPPPVDETLVRLAEAGPDLAARFAERARAVGVTVTNAIEQSHRQGLASEKSLPNRPREEGCASSLMPASALATSAMASASGLLTLISRRQPAGSALAM